MRFLLLCFLLSSTLFCFGQGSTARDSSDVGKKGSGISTMFKGHPGKAFALSLALPGAGQAYNRRYWKVPFALAIEGYLMYRIIDESNKFNRLNTKWHAFLQYPDINPIECGELSYTSASIVYTDRESTRKNRDNAYLYFTIGHLLLSIEAFVDRHLIDFDIDEDLSVRFKPQTTFDATGSVSIAPMIGVTIPLY